MNPLSSLKKSGIGESSRIPRESGASIGYAWEPEPDQPTRASESRSKTARPHSSCARNWRNMKWFSFLITTKVLSLGHVTGVKHRSRNTNKSKMSNKKNLEKQTLQDIYKHVQCSWKKPSQKTYNSEVHKKMNLQIWYLHKNIKCCQERPCYKNYSS